MAPKRETILSSPSRCLAAGTVLLGVLLCAEYARPARAENGCWSDCPPPTPGPAPAPDQEDRKPTANDREARGDALASLHDAIADLGSGDAATRETAQERIVELGETFADDVAVQIATTRNLEVKTRLLEVLETWRRKAYQKNPILKDPSFKYWRPYAKSAEVARSGGTAMSMNTSTSSSGFMSIDGGFDW